MKKNKITILRKKVDGKIEFVDTLMKLLASSQDDAKVLLAEAQTELDEATENYRLVAAGYNELKSRCIRVSTFVSKLLDV